MAYKIGDQMQKTFLPSIIDDYVGSQAPVRVYDAFVDALNFNELGISLQPSFHGGADKYYPKQLMKLLIWGYSYGIRSSRKFERACHDNLSFIWLMGGLKPDYRTISRFRSDHKDAIKKILKQCVRMCMDMNLIEGNTLFVDGSKFRANASINHNWTKKSCEESLKKIEEHIDQIIDESEQTDASESKEQSLVKLKEQIHDKAKLINTMKDVLTKLNVQNKDSINTTDEDSVKTKGRQGTHASYNVQSTVDSKHGLIVHAEAVSQSNDYNQLAQQITASSETLGQSPKNVCADAGYADTDDLKTIDPAINIVVPSRRQAQEEKGLHPIKAFDKSHFIYDQHKDIYTCPEGKTLKFVGIPDPGKRRYKADGSQCQACSHFGKCTRSPDGRRIIRLAEELFKEQLEANYKCPENQEIYKLRKQKVELPFGHIKRNLGAGQFMLRSRNKVNAEVSLLATCFNIARMITLIGISPLLTRLSSA